MCATMGAVKVTSGQEVSRRKVEQTESKEAFQRDYVIAPRRKAGQNFRENPEPVQLTRALLERFFGMPLSAASKELVRFMLTIHRFISFVGNIRCGLISYHHVVARVFADLANDGTGHLHDRYQESLQVRTMPCNFMVFLFSKFLANSHAKMSFNDIAT